MKQIATILSLVLFVACSNHKAGLISSDSTHAVFIRNADGSQKFFFTKGKIEVREIRSLPSDSSSNKVEWRIDTSLTMVYVPLDTARTPDHKPIFLDSSRKVPKIDSGWKDFGPYDHHLGKITIIN